MRGVPRGGVRATARSVVMTHLSAALSVACPVLAGPVVIPWEDRAVELRSGQDVVHVGTIAPTLDHQAVFVERALLAQVVVIPVQIVDILGDLDTPRVVPWTAPDPVPSVDWGSVARGTSAEIGSPRALPRTGGPRQSLAVPIGSSESA